LGNRGREGRGAWEAHHVNANGEDILSNCEILCWDCHKNTGSFGVS
jgi:5-methylcytosine-specific restriction endonuclease McrA